MIKISHLDHIVFTVKSIARSVAFYTEVLGMKREEFVPPHSNIVRTALVFGEQVNSESRVTQKINLHQVGKEFEPKANKPTSGSADVCFISSTPISDVVKFLEQHPNLRDQVSYDEDSLTDPQPEFTFSIVEKNVFRTGATGRRIISVYVRDPDENLIEISNYVKE